MEDIASALAIRTAWHGNNANSVDSHLVECVFGGAVSSLLCRNLRQHPIVRVLAFLPGSGIPLPFARSGLSFASLLWRSVSPSPNDLVALYLLECSPSVVSGYCLLDLTKHVINIIATNVVILGKREHVATDDIKEFWSVHMCLTQSRRQYKRYATRITDGDTKVRRLGSRGKRDPYCTLSFLSFPARILSYPAMALPWHLEV